MSPNIHQDVIHGIFTNDYLGHYLGNDLGNEWLIPVVGLMIRSS